MGSLQFPCPTRDGSWYGKRYIERCWEKVAPKHGVKLTWYQATRHTFTSRALQGGATLDEVVPMRKARKGRAGSPARQGSGGKARRRKVEGK